MKVKLHNSHVLIGAKASTEHALNLPLVPPEESSFTINDKQYVNYFCSSLKSNSSDSYANEDSLNENKVTPLYSSNQTVKSTSRTIRGYHFL